MGNGCPKCYSENRGEIFRKAVVKRRGSLADKDFDLSKEWHPTKNEELTPRDVTSGSGKKVWWLCSRGHEWEAVVKSRSRGHGCPYCSGRRATKENNFAVKYPVLSKEWHQTKNGQLTPHDVTPGSTRKVWWLCNRGHELELSVNNRIKRKRSCRECYLEDKRSK